VRKSGNTTVIGLAIVVALAGSNHTRGYSYLKHRHRYASTSAWISSSVWQGS